MSREASHYYLVNRKNAKLTKIMMMKIRAQLLLLSLKINNNDDEKKTKLLNAIAKLTIIMMMKKWRSVTNIGVAHVVTITYNNRFLNYFTEI